ncbi:5-formyltetrahydrofolate cyclo-ligase [Neomegalonema perideroedes]|uniref:5-formyltetrahydrofolate cyclo-ligase n=1 Tax=Neomegalonema perideroedes TaxID=217219 RepID=UPI0003706521|nr:5-formyltetrahydrofolate cyclo-ligase [Neomegalonema perideroedes]
MMVPAAFPLKDMAARKAALRREALARREAAFAAQGAEAAQAAARRFMAAAPARGGVWAGYWPIRSEMDPLPLLRLAHEAGSRVALPVILGKGRPLAFRLWIPDLALIEGPFGARVPPPGSPEVEPDVLAIPLVAFDRSGGRLGYGGGFYDRTLADLRARKSVWACGLAFSAQESANLPQEPTDAPLDAVATERETILLTREGETGA